jgi:uncharacterized protein YndB with AHSA1/START domain
MIMLERFIIYKILIFLCFLKSISMNLIKVASIINAPISKVWESWTKEEHVINWNFAIAGWQMILDNFKKYVEQ